MAVRYAEEQFANLRLPGFRNEAGIWNIAGQATDWQTVLSLSIYSENPANPDQIDVLTGIRAHDTETHPHVVSTPTSRFPQPFQGPVLESRRNVYQEVDLTDSLHELARDSFTSPGTFRLDKVDVRENQTVASFLPNVTELPNREDPFAYLAHEPLARKLGMGDALQNRGGAEPMATISLAEIIAGFSYAADRDDGTPLWEPLLMYAGVVFLRDRSLIPQETVAYRKLGWVSTTDFISGHMDKSSERLVPAIDRSDVATVCVRGLCLTTTSTVTIGSQLRAHLGLKNTRESS